MSLFHHFQYRCFSYTRWIFAPPYPLVARPTNKYISMPTRCAAESLATGKIWRKTISIHDHFCTGSEYFLKHKSAVYQVRFSTDARLPSGHWWWRFSRRTDLTLTCYMKKWDRSWLQDEAQFVKFHESIFNTEQNFNHNMNSVDIKSYFKSPIAIAGLQS